MVTVDDLPALRADQVFVDTAAADQPARGAVWGCAAVVDLAGRKPAIGHHELAAVAGGLVGQQRPNQSHCGVAHGPPVGAPPHTAFHRGHVKILDHDAAVAARQRGGELVGSFPPQVHAPPI